MTKQAGIRAFLLPKAQSHVSIWNVIDLVGPGTEQQRIHDAWHMAGNAATAFGIGVVMCVGRQPGRILEFLMTIGARPIRLTGESQRSRICG